ncbi:MAG: type II toxin-antitoxin system VapC family toxin [Actinomycetota bacterium]
MKLVDANVLLRYLTKDDKARAERCRDLLVASGEELLITDLALAEVVWVLESQYDMTPEDIFKVVSPIVSAPQLTIIDRDILLDALYLYKANDVDFIDAYHAALGNWIAAEPIYSYDEKDFPKLGFPREEP